MTTCKEESLRWVHRYAIGGAAFAAIPIPVSTSAGLAMLETHLATFIGSIYGETPTGAATAAAGGAFTVGGQALKYAAMQATCFIPVLGSAIRMGIAGAAIEGIGHAVVNHYERRHPGKPFTRAVA